MPTLVNLTLHEGNDETVAVTILPEAGGSLAGVTSLVFVMKPSTCESDADANAVTLTTGAGITILTQAPALITATILIPRTALVASYERAWRLDALTLTARRTALYGTITVVDL